MAGLDGSDPRDGIVRRQRAKGVEGFRQEIGTGLAQRFGMRGEQNAGGIAGNEVHLPFQNFVIASGEAARQSRA
jgi:hypothetical protein